MTKKKKQKTNAIRLVEQKKVPYQEHEYVWQEDQLKTEMKTNSQLIYKTLLAVGNTTGPIVAVIPIEKELDLKKIAKVSGNKKVEMLPLKDLEATTGYLRGGCSPVGMKKVYPTYFDQTAEQLPTVIVSAGRQGLQMELSPVDLAKLVRGEFAELTHT